MRFFSSFRRKRANGNRSKQLQNEPASTHSSNNPSCKATSQHDEQQKAQHQSVSDDMKEQVMSPHGVSLAFMHDLMEDVEAKRCVPNTNLVVLKRDITLTLADGTIKDLQTGRTAKVLNEDRTGRIYTIRVPYVNEAVNVPMADFEPKSRHQWTVEDICEHVVKPATMKNQSFFHQEIDQKHVGPKHKGAFVSQARSTKFKVLLDALTTWCVTEQVNPAECYVWLDAFSANQPLLTSGDVDQVQQDRREWILKYGLHDMIAKFDYTVLVLDSWQQAFALNRAWCLWELYGAVVKRKDGFMVTLPRAETDNFDKVMRYEYDSIVKSLIDVDVANAQCNVARDRELIMNEVGSKVEKVNNVVQTHMRAWFLRSGHAHLDRLRADAATTNTVDVPILMMLLGSLYRDQGLADKAEVMFLEALKIQKIVYGPWNILVAMTESALGLLYSSQGKYNEAEAMYKDAVAIHSMNPMEGDAAIVQMAMVNLGLLYYEQLKYDQAEALFLQTLEAFKTLNMSTHSTVATIQNNLGCLYRDQGKYDEAEVMFLNSLKLYKDNYGPIHPEVATTETNLGTVYYNQRRYDVASAMFVGAVRVLNVVHGPTHPDIAYAESSLGVLYMAQGKFMESAAVLFDARRIYSVTYGSNHPLALKNEYYISVLQEQSGLFNNQ